jgi:hypothetical protein
MYLLNVQRKIFISQQEKVVGNQQLEKAETRISKTMQKIQFSKKTPKWFKLHSISLIAHVSS